LPRRQWRSIAGQAKGSQLQAIRTHPALLVTAPVPKLRSRTADEISAAASSVRPRGIRRCRLAWLKVY
jgi:hypothetical protein